MKLIFTGDWHIGNGKTDEARIMYIATNYWKDDPVFLMGDLIDCGLDRGMNFDNELNPQEQIDKIETIAEILNVQAYVIGNHENRIFTKTGLNPYKQIFKMEPTYEHWIDYKKIYINHGKSTAQNHFLEHTRYAQWNDANVIALGHSHVLAKLTTLSGGKPVHYIRTGHLFDEPQYAKKAGYAPLIQGWAEYETETDLVTLKAIYKKEVKEI